MRWVRRGRAGKNAGVSAWRRVGIGKGRTKMKIIGRGVRRILFDASRGKV